MAAEFAQQQSGDPLYYLQATYGPNLGNYCIAYVPSAPIANEPISLPDSWNNPGVYVFLNQTPVDQGVFAKNLADYLTDPAFPNAVFLWIANPNDPLAQWVSTRICVQNGAISQPGQWSLNNLSLFAGASCTVAPNEPGDGFTVTAPDTR